MSRFTFTAVATVPGLYQVRLGSLAGQLLGTVVESADGWKWRATSIGPGGKVRTRSFPDREDAAAWLLGRAPRGPKVGG